jgi:hypothetical protein
MVGSIKSLRSVRSRANVRSWAYRSIATVTAAREELAGLRGRSSLSGGECHLTINTGQGCPNQCTTASQKS